MGAFSCPLLWQQRPDSISGGAGAGGAGVGAAGEEASGHIVVRSARKQKKWILSSDQFLPFIQSRPDVGVISY